MSLAIDTSVLIDLEQGHKKTINQLKEIIKSYLGKPSIPFMVYTEAMHGIEGKSDKKKEKALRLIEQFHFLSPSKSCAKKLAKLRHKYDRSGKCIESMDLFIAAQVIDQGLVLVTRDKTFKQIEELDVLILDS